MAKKTRRKSAARKKTSKKKTTRKKASASGAPRASRGLGAVSVGDLKRELRRRERQVRSLESKRGKLLDQLASVDKELASLGGSIAGLGGANGGPRRRPRNEQNLVDALADLLNGKQLSVTDAAAKVQEAGYQTSSENFRTIVNQTLINSGRFKRIGRGVYTTK